MNTPRNCPPESQLTQDLLHRLFWDEKLNQIEIATKLGYDVLEICTAMKRFGVSFQKTRRARRRDITTELLHILYVERGMNQGEIANLLNCTRTAIYQRLRKFGISRRSLANARTQYPKKNFDGSLIEKAYLIGFRQGDLHVRKALVPR